MILQVLSDIHVEFHKDHGESFLDAFDASKVDVLIIAGDLIPLTDMTAVSKLFEKLSKYKRILFVPGNHEYYGLTSINDGIMRLGLLEQRFENLTVLDNKLVTIEGIDFIGSTLWFPFDKQRDWGSVDLINDFSLIGGLQDDVNKRYEESSRYLAWHTTPNSIVITHHFPLPNSIHADFYGSELNKFFGCDLSEIIDRTTPKLWVHGHTHKSFNYMYGKTHVVCNPFGYLAYDMNTEFVLNLLIKT